MVRPSSFPWLIALLVLPACSASDSGRRPGGSPDAGPESGAAGGGNGGTTSNGGTMSTRGASDSGSAGIGGSTGNGGPTSSGGASSAGGAVDASIGGSPGSGGTSSNGGGGGSGATEAGSGGSPGSGGIFFGGAAGMPDAGDASDGKDGAGGAPSTGATSGAGGIFSGGSPGSDAGIGASGGYGGAGATGAGGNSGGVGGGTDGATPVVCNDSALAQRRNACEFTTGAMARDTVGPCTGAAIPIEHIVIIMQENRSFDHYYGHLPGHGQDDVDGAPATTTNPDPKGGAPVPWHHESAYCVSDTNHGWNGSHKQWNGGLNDGFTSTNVSTADPSGTRAMGYYEQTDLPFYYSLASTFAISDRYFCSVLGPTFPNRLYLAGGTSFGIITTDVNKLAPAGVPNIYRQLTDRGITWRDYYYDLPTAALFYDYYTELTQTAPEHFAASSQFVTDAASGSLPQVSFLDARFLDGASLETDEHPPGDIQLGQHWVWEQITAVMNGPEWPRTAVFFTYDEHGGLYDHVSPPPACVPDAIPPDPTVNPVPGGFDRLGFRVPLTVISPYARRHFVSHEVHSHTSILRFLEAKFELPAMTGRDANSDALLDVFDFASPPDLSVPSFTEPPVDQAALDYCRATFP